MADHALTLRQTQILLALAESPNHGYAIGKAVELATGGTLLPGSLYRALSQLLRRGLIEETGGAVVDPRRREYRLTAPGRKALEHELANLGSLVEQGRRLGLVPRRS